jgi:hypothetical protein
MTTAAKKIGAFRTSGVNPRPEAPQQPADARTMDEALEGLMRATAGPAAALQHPSMAGGNGAVIVLNGHAQRVPEGAYVSGGRAGDRDLTYVMSKQGRIWILVSTHDGVRELIGMPDELLQRIRRERFGAE